MTDLATVCEFLAVELLGWEQTGFANDCPLYESTLDDYNPVSLSDLNTWAGAGEVVEAMQEIRWRLSLTREEQGEWLATFEVSPAFYGEEPEYSEAVYADTAPEAILRAAYSALQGTDDDS